MTSEELSAETGAGRCAYHPERAAIGTCSRCGTFHCQSCFKDLAGRRLCTGCLALPGIDYLQTLKDKSWGKRDAWVWYFGVFGGLAALGQLVQTARLGQWSLTAAFLVSSSMAVGYLALQRWARVGLYSIPLAGVLQGTHQIATTAHVQSAPLHGGAAIAGAVISALFVTAALRSTRNKLAFRLDVSEAALQKLHAATSNGLARRALAYGLLSLFIPGLGVFTGIAGWTALRRVKQTDWPPIGGRRQALWGLGFSALSTLVWCTVLVLALLRRGA